MKPNVLHLINSFHQGGTERQAVQLVRLLSESGRYRVHLACLDAGGVLRAEVERPGFGEIPEFPLNSFYDRNMAAQLSRFKSFLREREIDVLHTHDFYTNVFGMTGAAWARLPLVRIASRRETGGMRSRAQKFVQRRAFARAHAVVANAEAVRRELIAEGVRADKIETIYNGLDLKRLTPPENYERDEALAQFHLEEVAGRRLVTIVANMRHPVKDQRTFLRAARRVKAEIPDAAFVLAGEGELEAALRAFAAELELERDAFFTGRCERVALLLALSEVCVLSSTHEGFSNSILEYMAASRPVVATDVGGVREALVEGETGYVVAPGDDEAMAARIISLLRDAERAREFGRAGRRVVEEKFSPEAQLARTEKLYERLLEMKRAARVAPRREEEAESRRRAAASERL
ncbi:MAG TPA: glycosyltransferase [Pyrinomonadaceae bacterium]